MGKVVGNSQRTPERDQISDFRQESIRNFWLTPDGDKKIWHPLGICRERKPKKNWLPLGIPDGYPMDNNLVS